LATKAFARCSGLASVWLARSRCRHARGTSVDRIMEPAVSAALPREQVPCAIVQRRCHPVQWSLQPIITDLRRPARICREAWVVTCHDHIPDCSEISNSFGPPPPRARTGPGGRQGLRESDVGMQSSALAFESLRGDEKELRLGCRLPESLSNYIEWALAVFCAPSRAHRQRNRCHRSAVPRDVVTAMRAVHCRSGIGSDLPQPATLPSASITRGRHGRGVESLSHTAGKSFMVSALPLVLRLNDILRA
jgi:hypothetical protein